MKEHGPTHRLGSEIWLGPHETQQTYRSMDPTYPETELTDLAVYNSCETQQT